MVLAMSLCGQSCTLPWCEWSLSFSVGVADDKLPTNSYAFWAAGFNAWLSVDVVSSQGVYSTPENRPVAMFSGRIIWYQLPVEMWA